jgi:RecB family exonuclease
MAVTRVEALTRDPYAVWARDILKLYPLDRPDEPVEARARGTAIHAAFEKFAETIPARAGRRRRDLRGLYLGELVKAGMPPPPWPANAPWPAKPRCGSPTGDAAAAPGPSGSSSRPRAS